MHSKAISCTSFNKTSGTILIMNVFSLFYTFMLLCCKCEVRVITAKYLVLAGGVSQVPTALVLEPERACRSKPTYCGPWIVTDTHTHTILTPHHLLQDVQCTLNNRPHFGIMFVPIIKNLLKRNRLTHTKYKTKICRIFQGGFHKKFRIWFILHPEFWCVSKHFFFQDLWRNPVLLF